jgi:ketosteroid isomerase-like protein
MKQICCLFGLLSLGGVAWSQAQQTTGEAENAVAALENQWLESERTNKPDMAAALMADRFVATGTDGTVASKAEDLGGTPTYTSADNYDLKVTVFGGTAIVTGTHKSKGTSKQGKPFDAKYRFTDTWVKMPGGKWQCVAVANSPLRD